MLVRELMLIGIVLMIKYKTCYNKIKGISCLILLLFSISLETYTGDKVFTNSHYILYINKKS